jgi:hypothetical protein
MIEIIDSSPDAVERLKRQKIVMLVIMLLLSGLFGVLDSFYAATPGADRALFIADTLSFAFCLSVWCASDAQLRGFRLSRGLRWTIILIALIGFPVYAFRSRGRRGWSLFGLGVLFFLLLMAASVGTGWITDIIRGDTE